MLFWQLVEQRAAEGAARLLPQSRQQIAAAVRSRQCGCGGFAGLDQRLDAYYSLFAWLVLRALGESSDFSGLYAWLRRGRFTKRVDRYCGIMVLAAAGEISKLRLWWELVRVVLGGGRGDLYALFMLGVVAERLLPAVVVRWCAGWGWRRIEAAGIGREVATPRLVVRLIMAVVAGKRDDEVVDALAGRRVASGGYGSAAGSAADLLATGVVRFALGLAGDGEREAGDGLDRVFVELCWQEDGLFSAAPEVSRGDVEHTFYGLLALA